MEKKTVKNVDNVEDADRYPGIAPNIADKCKVDEEAVKADVKNLNNNPRNDGRMV